MLEILFFVYIMINLTVFFLYAHKHQKRVMK